MRLLPWRRETRSSADYSTVIQDALSLCRSTAMRAVAEAARQALRRGLSGAPRRA